MFVRLTELESDKKSMDQNIDYVNQQVVPTLQQSPADGFKGAYWLADRDAGKLVVFTLWESEDAMRTSEETMKQAREQNGGNGKNGDGLKQKGSARYEVVAVAATPGVSMQSGVQGGATR